MQQSSLGRQNVKILNFELFTHICRQLGYATAEPCPPKRENYKFQVI